LSGAGLFIPFYFAVGCPTSLCHGCPCWQPGYLRRKSNFRVAQQKIWFEKRKFQKKLRTIIHSQSNNIFIFVHKKYPSGK